MFNVVMRLNETCFSRLSLVWTSTVWLSEGLSKTTLRRIRKLLKFPFQNFPTYLSSPTLPPSMFDPPYRLGHRQAELPQLPEVSTRHTEGSRSRRRDISKLSPRFGTAAENMNRLNTISSLKVHTRNCARQSVHKLKPNRVCISVYKQALSLSFEVQHSQTDLSKRFIAVAQNEHWHLHFQNCFQAVYIHTYINNVFLHVLPGNKAFL